MLDREIIEEEIKRVRSYIKYLEAQLIEEYDPDTEQTLIAARERIDTLYWVLED